MTVTKNWHPDIRMSLFRYELDCTKEILGNLPEKYLTEKNPKKLVQNSNDDHDYQIA